MNGPQFSFDRPPHRDDDAPYAWLDEWLCEYVDGTMDPALETVFEEYVRANPELEAHVENLRETRALLGQSCCSRLKASRRARAQVCGQVECEMLKDRASFSEVPTTRLVTGGVASVAVALLVGFFAGALYFDPSAKFTSLPASPDRATFAPSATQTPFSSPALLMQSAAERRSVLPSVSPAPSAVASADSSAPASPAMTAP